jgi:hypothetical protein
MQIPTSILSDPSFGFLTTMRCSTRESQSYDLPLLEEHLDRLVSVWVACSTTDPELQQRDPSASAFRVRLNGKILEFAEDQSPGDYRVSRPKVSSRVSLAETRGPASSGAFHSRSTRASSDPIACFES